MIEGIIKLNFNVFRAVPFRRCTLQFNTGIEVSVAPIGSEPPFPLEVKFQDLKVILHPFHSGAYKESDSNLVEEFRERFFKEIQEIDFSIIDSERFLDRNFRHKYEELIRLRYNLPDDEDARIVRILKTRESSISKRSPRSSDQIEISTLANQVRQFVDRAQADYRSFFALREPDLFARIITQLEKKDLAYLTPPQLISRLQKVFEMDKAHSKLGLSIDRWNFDQLKEKLSNTNVSPQAISVIAS